MAKRRATLWQLVRYEISRHCMKYNAKHCFRDAALHKMREEHYRHVHRDDGDDAGPVTRRRLLEAAYSRRLSAATRCRSSSAKATGRRRASCNGL